MKVVSAKWLLPATCLVLLWTVPARAEDKPAQPAAPATTPAAPSAAASAKPAETPDNPSPEQIKAKIEYCSICHGKQGQGYRGASPVPRLAGQQVDYIENQLNAFVEHRRHNVYMFNVAHVLGPNMRAALAKHFHDLNPPPTASAPTDIVAAGKKIFEEGLPSAEVPPCASCHGPEAKGEGQFPRLAGQSYAYIKKTLATWEKVRGQDPNNPDASAMMQPIAHNLTQTQIDSVAAFLDHHE
jgi:cytochrome c553